MSATISNADRQEWITAYRQAHLITAEKTGFPFCVEALRDNASGVIETGKMLQEIEAKNG